MKKSLVIISFAFIFLLTMSVVSASWFGDFWAKVTGRAGAGDCEEPFACKSPEGPCTICPTGVAPGSVIGAKKTTAGVAKVSSPLTKRPIPGMSRRPVARLPPTENDLPTGGERSLKGLNISNATIGLAGEKFKINFTNQTNTTQTETWTCKDWDGGKIYNVKGNTILVSSLGSTAGNVYDYCSGTSLTEYYCDLNAIQGENYACPNGCSNGACLP